MAESIFNKLKERMGKTLPKKEETLQKEKTNSSESSKKENSVLSESSKKETNTLAEGTKKDKIESILSGIKKNNGENESSSEKKVVSKKDSFSEKDLIVEEAKKITPPVENIEKKRTVVGGLFDSIDTKDIHKSKSEEKDFFVGDSFSKKSAPIKKPELLLKKESAPQTKKLNFEKFIDGLDESKTEVKKSEQKTKQVVKEKESKNENKDSDSKNKPKFSKKKTTQKKEISYDYKAPSINNEYFGDKKESEPEYLKSVETEASIAKELFDENIKKKDSTKKEESKLLNLITLIVILISIIILFFAWTYFFGG